MTGEQIYALGGPALTQVAYTLGLAPPDAQMYRAGEAWLVGPGGAYQHWQPHTNIAHAEAGLRMLRVDGWRTRVSGGSEDGEAYAEKRIGEGRQDYARVRVGWPVEAPTEALALLLCAVLAAASEGEASA